MKNLMLIIFIFSYCCLLFSCKKEPDPVVPAIFILQPSEYTEYDTADTIRVTLLVEAEKSEVYLKIVLQNEAFINVMPTLIIENFDTGTETSLDYFLEGQSLEAGIYLLLVSADDGNNTVNEYLPLWINAVPRELKNIFVVTKESSNSLAINKYPTDFQDPETKTIPGDYSGSAVSSAYQLFFVAGSHSGDLLAMDADSLETVWSIPIIPNPVQPYFTMMVWSDPTLFTGYYAGYLRGYNRNGEIVFNTPPYGNTMPDLLVQSENMIVCATTSISNVFQHYAESWYYPSGNPGASALLSFRPVFLADIGGGQVLIFGNDDENNMTVKSFNAGTGLVTSPYQPFTLPEEPLICASRLTFEKTLVGMPDGIYIYHYQSGYYLLSDVATPAIITFEDISSTIWAVKDGAIYVIDLEGNELFQYVTGDDIMSLHFLYNR